MLQQAHDSACSSKVVLERAQRLDPVGAEITVFATAMKQSERGRVARLTTGTESRGHLDSLA
jgi:hypothetical protein